MVEEELVKTNWRTNTRTHKRFPTKRRTASRIITAPKTMGVDQKKFKVEVESKSGKIMMYTVRASSAKEAATIVEHKHPGSTIKNVYESKKVYSYAWDDWNTDAGAKKGVRWFS